MSKMKEIDSIAQGVADYMKELLYDTVQSGRSYSRLHERIIIRHC